MNPGARTYSLLLFTFGTLLLCLLGSAAYSLLRAREMGHSADHLVQASGPATAALIDLRVELRRLELLVETTPSDPSPEDQRRLEESRTKLEHLHASYLDLLPANRNQVGRAELHAAVESVERELGSRPESQEEHLARLAPLIERADQAAQRMSRLDAVRTVDQASRLDELQHTFSRRALMLDLFSVFVAIAGGICSFWAIRRFTRLREAHALVLQERADELEQFAGRVAHDILSPLNVVSLSIDLAMRTANPEEARLRLERGLTSLQRATRIVNGLLSFARAGAHPDPEVHTELKGVLDDVVSGHRPIAAEREVCLLLEELPSAVVQCEAGVLTSVVSNLVHNAIKYVGKGKSSWVKVRARELADAVRIEVEDNGPGLSAELACRAFEPYVRGPEARAETGIGLGLATVRRIAQAHHGQVGVDRAPGGGCLFWFELPKGPPPAPKPRASRAQLSLSPPAPPR